ncbi:MAG: acyl-CoA dehydrogenase family protein [Ilumatobacteraceae bacterium]
MRAHTKVEIMRFLSYKALTSFLHGHQPGADASIGKLFWSHYHQEITELAIDILGADALVPTGQAPQQVFGTDAPGSPNDSANWTGVFFNARAGTIYAGTSQVQKGIVGEQILGLPKEPRADGGRGTRSRPRLTEQHPGRAGSGTRWCPTRCHPSVSVG